MASEGMVDPSVHRAGAQTEIYPPSWVDRVTAWIDRLPGPAWLAYLAVIAVLNLGNAALEWGNGSYPVGTFLPVQIVTMSAGVLYLAMMHYLDGVAARALAQFRPALADDAPSYDELVYRLTTMPARPTLAATLAGLVYGLALNYVLMEGIMMPGVMAYTSPLTTWLNSLIVVGDNLMWVVFCYHTLHQLRMINRIYTTHATVDLFEQSPLYAFSRFTALTAFIWVAIAYVWLATFRNVERNPVTPIMAAVVALLSLAVFLWPLVGIHRLLDAEKVRFRVAAGRRFRATIDDLHRSIDERKLDAVGGLNEVLSGLRQEMEILDRIPTWPWQPETPRALLTAVFLPLVLWGLTRVLEGMFAG